MGNNSVRKNRNLIHTPPHWVENNASFFITINCQERGTNQIATSAFFETAIETSKRLLSKKRWHPEILLLMPDHIHMVASFPWDKGNGMSSVIRDWKRFTARACGIKWQRDYFDHRIRSKEDHQSTWSYIVENPVRARLVEEPTKWPYVWRPETD